MLDTISVTRVDHDVGRALQTREPAIHFRRTAIGDGSTSVGLATGLVPAD